MSESQQNSVTSIGIGTRLLFGIVTGAILTIGWRFLVDDWPSLFSKWWYWLLTGIAGLAVFLFSPVLIIFCRHARIIAHVQSPEFRLQNSNIWTEAQHVEDGGATQLMRMEDGYFILLSVGTTSTKVFVTPKLESQALFNELASFPVVDFAERLTRSRQDRMAEDEVILRDLRKRIGWPKTVEELRRNLEKIGT